MSDDLTSFLNDGPDGSAPANADTGKGLRAQLEQALALNAKLAEQVNAINANSRKREVDDLFSSAGIPDGYRPFFPTEGDVEAAGKAFIETHGALWGANPQAPVTAPDGQSAMAAMQAVAAQAQTPNLSASYSEGDFRAQFAGAATYADLQAQVAEAAARYGA